MTPEAGGVPGRVPIDRISSLKDKWMGLLEVVERRLRMALQSDTVQCNGQVVVNIFVMYIYMQYREGLFSLWSGATMFHCERNGNKEALTL